MSALTTKRALTSTPMDQLLAVHSLQNGPTLGQLALVEMALVAWEADSLLPI
jgi:hypothetical protein